MRHSLLCCILTVVGVAVWTHVDAQFVVVQAEGVVVRAPGSYDKVVDNRDTARYVLVVEPGTNVGECTGYSVVAHRDSVATARLTELLFVNDVMGVLGLVSGSGQTRRIERTEIESMVPSERQIVLQNGSTAVLQQKVVGFCGGEKATEFRGRITIDQTWESAVPSEDALAVRKVPKTNVARVRFY